MRELLLCPPDHYGIEYEINPWMSRARGADAALAQKQWKDLHATLSKLDCKIELITPQTEASGHGFHGQRRSHGRKEIYPEQFSPQRTRR